jgi:phage terminase large subunit
MAQLRTEVARVFQPLLQPSRYKGAYGGRGSAKSWHFAGELVRTHIRQPNMRSVCIREVQKSLDQSVKRLLEDRIKAYGADGYFRVLDTHIETGRGGLILFQGMQNHTAASIKSLEGYGRAWVEEAQSLSQRSLDLLRPTIRVPGSEIWFSWNPSQPTDPVDAFLRGPNPPADAIVVKATYRDNPWFGKPLSDEMAEDRARDYEKYLHVWEGEYEQHSEANVFRNYRVREFDTPARAQFYFGADWGYAIDPTVLVRCWIDGRTLYIDREVYKVGCEIDHIPTLFDQLDPTQPGQARRWTVIADSARPETISYLQRHGYPQLRAAKKGSGSVEEGVQFLQSYDIVLHPRCVNTIREFGAYRYQRDRLTGKVIPELEDADNHVIDAVRYATESVRRDTKTVAVILPRK